MEKGDGPSLLRGIGGGGGARGGCTATDPNAFSEVLVRSMLHDCIAFRVNANVHPQLLACLDPPIP